MECSKRIVAASPAVRRVRHLILALFAFAALVHAADAALAAEINVPGDQPTIQAAINAANPSDTIIVADGTYTGTSNINLDFGGKVITVKSENGATNCIIDCENAGRAFHFHSGETSSAVVDGFTIQNGKVFDDVGGGIYCENSSSPTIRNCIVKNCKAEYLSGSGIEQVDQVQDSYSGYEYFSDSDTMLAQTFKPAEDDDVASVKLNVHLESGSVVLRVKVKQGNPDSASTEYTSDPVAVSSSGVHEFPFQAGSRLSVTTGNTYSLIVYKESGTGECAIYYDPNNPYADGTMWGSIDGGSTWTQEASNDLYFEIISEGGGGGGTPEVGPCQYSGNWDAGWSLADTSYKVGQTFTVSEPVTLYGAKVWAIQGNGFPGKLFYEVWKLDSGVPGTGVQIAPVTPSSGGSTDVVVFPDPQTQLVPGETYFLITDGPGLFGGNNGCYPYFTNSDNYPGGRSYGYNGGWVTAHEDLKFEIWIIKQTGILVSQTDSSAYRYLTPVSSLGQSFQPGVDGDMTKLVLRTNKTAAQAVDLTVELHTGSETGAVIATETVSVPDGENEITINFSATPTLVKDTTYTFTVEPSVATAGLSGLAISASDVYSRGEAVHDSQRDLYFKTYMFVTDVFVNSGGGICIANASPALVNCVIASNTSDSMGAGIYCGGVSSPTITNCTIADNSAPSGYGGGIYCSQAQPELNNSILWGNSAASGGNQIYTFDSGDTVALNYCDYASGGGDVEGSGTVTPSNCTSSNPVFAGVGDYHLGDTSPCIDAGENTLASGITTDLDGNPRLVDGDDPPDGTATVDIGAYEYNVVIDPPTNFSGVGVATNQIEWTWNDAAGATAYLLEDLGFNRVALIAPGAQQYTETTLTGENTPATRLLRSCRTALTEVTVEPAGSVEGAALPWSAGGYHAQYLYTVAELSNTEGSIKKIYWQRFNSGIGATYTDVTAALGHSTRTDLENNCASNFDVDGPTVVRDPAQYDVSAASTAREWVELPLDRGFYYNGTNNLVIDIDVAFGTESISWSQVTVTGDYHSLYGISGSSSGEPWERKFFLKLEIEVISSTSDPATASAYTLVHDATVDDFELAPGGGAAEVVVTVTPPPNESAGLTGVKIERATNDTFTQDATTLQDFSASYSYTDAGLATGTYYYRVTFCNGDGTASGTSAGESITVLGADSPPVAQITAPTGGSHADNVQLEYNLRDYDSDPAEIIAHFSLDSGATWSTCTMGSGGDGTTPLATSLAGTSHIYVWDTVTDDVGTSVPEAVQVRITPSDKDGTGTPGVTSFTVSNTPQQPPVVAITDPTTGTRGGDIAVAYTLTDANADDCDIIVEYSIDGASSWDPCTAGTGGEGVSALTASPSGTSHTFVWASETDLFDVSTSVMLQIIADDANAGTGGGTGSDTVTFFVDNTAGVTAHFNGSPVSGEAPHTVQFSDLSVGNITSYLWDFGDGGTSTQQNPSHEYSASGTYTVSLTVTSPSSSNTETRNGFISVGSAAAPPKDDDGGGGCRCAMDRKPVPFSDLLGYFLPLLLIACAYLALRRRTGAA